jgi:hypothetical protein
VVGVAVGEHHPPDVPEAEVEPGQRVPELTGAAGGAGVDEGDPLRPHPGVRVEQVGAGAAQLDPEQAGGELGQVHAPGR